MVLQNIPLHLSGLVSSFFFSSDYWSFLHPCALKEWCKHPSCYVTSLPVDCGLISLPLCHSVVSCHHIYMHEFSVPSYSPSCIFSPSVVKNMSGDEYQLSRYTAYPSSENVTPNTTSTTPSLTLISLPLTESCPVYILKGT